MRRGTARSKCVCRDYSRRHYQRFGQSTNRAKLEVRMVDYRISSTKSEVANQVTEVKPTVLYCGCKTEENANLSHLLEEFWRTEEEV